MIRWPCGVCLCALRLQLRTRFESTCDSQDTWPKCVSSWLPVQKHIPLFEIVSSRADSLMMQRFAKKIVLKKSPNCVTLFEKLPCRWLRRQQRRWSARNPSPRAKKHACNVWSDGAPQKCGGLNKGVSLSTEWRKETKSSHRLHQCHAHFWWTAEKMRHLVDSISIGFPYCAVQVSIILN